MGREEDPMAVVNTEGRVFGVEGLRVVDASIFPVVPCANTNIPTLMAAERSPKRWKPSDEFQAVVHDRP
jgi:5-(hydroxymethyl)furfural/furfural oxidase